MVFVQEELFRRLDIGMERLGSGLSDTAKELWLERAATKLENGKFQLNRDRRLALATPGVMSVGPGFRIHICDFKLYQLMD